MIKAALIRGQVSHSRLVRDLSVLAWGDNTSGQCGVETSSILTRPMVITELHGTHLQSLHAGPSHSMCVTRRGEVFSWGSDSAGQLGLGGILCQSFPSRIEALVSREAVLGGGVSLAESHSLILGSSGSLWACGSNTSGACGIKVASIAWTSPPQGHGFASKRDHVMSRGMALPSPVSTSRMSRMWREGGPNSLNAMIDQRERAISVYVKHLLKPRVPQEVMDFRSQMMPFLVTNGKRRPSIGGLFLGPWSAIDPKMSHEVELLTRPDHVLSPIRALTDEPGLQDQSFVSVSASASYSIGCTAAGEVWSWGEGREDGGRVPRPLDVDLEKEVQGLGGAVKVAAGLDFSLVLTAEGKVVACSRKSGRGFILQEFPRITDITSGPNHALISDGGRVWSISKALDGESIWESLPEEVLDLSNEGGVASMSCGLNSFGVASENGSLFMWGSLLDPDRANSLLTKNRGASQDQLPLDGDKAIVEWPGFGSSKPTKIDCLGHLRVKRVALGSHHALVSVE